MSIKYLIRKPADIRLIDESTTLCSILKKAQEGGCFYTGPENHTGEAATYLFRPIPILFKQSKQFV